MNLLREYIRELLAESAINSKIMSMIDRAEEAGYKVRLFNASNGGAVYLLAPGEVRSDRALGTVDWRRPGEKEHGLYASKKCLVVIINEWVWPSVV